jgi:hypothetical protein
MKKPYTDVISSVIIITIFREFSLDKTTFE